MELTAAVPVSSSESRPFLDRLNGEWHERSLKLFMAVVLAHWAFRAAIERARQTGLLLKMSE